jgi:hypothetical protein
MFSHFSVYSVPSVLKVFSWVEQSFQHRGHREESPSMEYDYALLPVLTG